MPGIRTQVFWSSGCQPSSNTAPSGPRAKPTQNVSCPPKRPTTSGNEDLNNVCRFFQRGKCIYGDKCYNLHSTDRRPQRGPSYRTNVDVKAHLFDNSSYHSASSSLNTSPAMSSSPLEEDEVLFESLDATTSTRQASHEADDSFVTVSSGELQTNRDFDSSFVTVDSERQNSFETVSETLTCEEKEIGDVENERKLTKREKKKEERIMIVMANKAQKKIDNQIRLEQTIREGYTFLEMGSTDEGQRVFAEAFLIIQRQDPEHSRKRRSEVYLGRALCHRTAGNHDQFVKDFNEASKDFEADGDFFVVTKKDFHVANGYLQILSGLTGPARECAYNAGQSKSKELSDLILKFEKLRSRVEASMNYASSMEGSAPADAINSEWKKSIEILHLAIEIAPLSSVLRLLQAECMTHVGLFNSALSLLKYQDNVIVEEREYAAQISKAIAAFMDYYTNDWSGLPSSINGRGPYAQNQVCGTFESLKMKQIRWGIFYRKLEKIQSMMDKARDVIQKPSELAEVYAASADLFKTPVKLASKHSFLHAMALLRCEDSDKNPVLSLLDRSIQLQANADALYERANLYFEMKDYDKALEDLYIAGPLSPCSSRIRLLSEKIRKTQWKTMRQSRVTPKRTFYQILGVEQKASEADIRKAYQSKAKENHPDRHVLADVEKKLSSEAEMKCINEAYETLKDAQSRRRYDQKQERDDDDSSDDEGVRFTFRPRYSFFDINDFLEALFTGFR